MKPDLSVSVIMGGDESNPDYRTVLAIRKAVFVEEQKVPLELEIDEHERESAHFLVHVDGKPAAAGRLRLKMPHVKFERIAVLAEYRGRGLGRVVTEAMTRYARERHPGHPMKLHAQVSAIGFYERLGWRCEGDPFDEAGIEHRVMVLEEGGKR